MKTTTLCAVMALTAMTLAANAAFLPSGKMALGANYWASHAATEMWRKWDAKAVDEDLRVLAANGFRVLRVFPNWADFQPIHACYLSADKFDQVNETRMFDSEEPLPDTPCGLPAHPRLLPEQRQLRQGERDEDVRLRGAAPRHSLRPRGRRRTDGGAFRGVLRPRREARNPPHRAAPYRADDLPQLHPAGAREPQPVQRPSSCRSSPGR